MIDRPISPDRGYADNRPTVRDIKTIHEGFGSGGCLTSSQKRYTQKSKGRVEGEVYNLSLPMTEVSPPITFTNKDLRGLHLPYDNALVVSVTIANFNI